LTEPLPPSEAEQFAASSGSRWWLLVKWTAILLAVVASLLAIAALLANSEMGRRLLAERIEQIEPDTGLRFSVGRIDGSIFGAATIYDVRVSDPQGEFLSVPEARLDWRPWDFVWRRRLSINDLIIPRASLSRLPELIDTGRDDPILPDFDIRIGRLRVDRLAVGGAVAGRAALVRGVGNADIRGGTADVRLDIDGIDTPDRVRLNLVAAPDREQFDIDADLVAPAGGLITGLAGLDRSLTGTVRGTGNWAAWTGALLIDAGDSALARLRLTANDGRYAAVGRVTPGLIMDGAIARLTAGGIAIDVAGTFVERRFDGRFAMVGDMLSLDGTGRVDLAANRLGNVRLDAWLRQPQAVLPRMDGQAIRLGLLLDGPFAGPRFEYRLTAPWLSFGTTRLTGVEARGQGVAGRNTAQIPVNLRVARVSGFGDLAERLVAGLSADGTLRWQGTRLTANNIRVQSAGLNGLVDVVADLDRGSYAVAFDGALPGMEIPGLGRVDVVTSLAVRPARGGVTIAGTGRATMRRLDNGLLLGLTGGLPQLTTGFSVGPDGIVRLSNVRISSTLLNATGSGIRRRDGSFQLSGSGVHRTYGPVTFALDGPIERPRVDLLLARPLNSAGLSGVRLQLVPNATGFAFTSVGQSTLGPFAADGNIVIGTNSQTFVDLRRLAVGGATASGRIAIVTGGLTGRLNVAGGGVSGTVGLAMPGGIQQLEIDLAARDAQFVGPPPFLVRRGRINATVLLDPGGTDVRATFSGTGIRRGQLSIARITGDAALVDGRGTVRISAAGARGRDFAIQLTAGITPDRVRINAAGRFNGRPIALVRPLVLTREDVGWRLEPAELTYAGSRSQLSGLLGASRTEIEARLERVPLSAIDIGWPRLGVSGDLSGTISYRSGNGAPTGSANLRVLRLTRSGLGRNAPPLDVALNAVLNERAGAVRAIIRAEGQTIGRVQARLAPLGGNDDLMARIQTAPMVAQLRYSGTVDTLWRLLGVEAVGLSGPVSIAADATGTLGDPRISGVLRTAGARLENVQTGTIINGVRAVGRFDGSRLQIRNISGTSQGGGTVSGSADFDLAAARGFAMDIRLQADRALLIERDDLTARVTGPIRILSDGNGGEISGNVHMDSGSFRLGQATAVEALPVLNVVELNAPADRPDPPTSTSPWRIAITARGTSRFMVTGMGLESEWATDIAVRGSVTNFSITGEANMVRGDYIFAGRRFALETGRIRFTGATPIDPILDIVAVDDIAGIDAQIRVRGTGQRPEITFTSNPALPEDELLSRILFGNSITDISVAEAAQLGVALASLRDGGGGLDPINAIRRSIGLDRLRILPANSEIGAGTSIAAGVNVTRRVYVEVITDGQGYSATRVEYQITRWLALLAAISTVGQESMNLRIQRNY
jgi:translocation and assembly module TamB